MPPQATPRGFLYGGIALVLLSGVVIVSPILWGEPLLANHLMDYNADLVRTSRSIDDIRDVVDVLRETRGAGLGYLLTGSPEDRAAYEKKVQASAESLADLRVAVDPQLRLKFQQLADRLLMDMARAVALQDRGQHDEAVTVSDIRTSRELIAQVDAITRKLVNDLRNRYQDVVGDIRGADDFSGQFARVMFGLAGALFTLGCIALANYQRHRHTAEVALRSGRDAALEASAVKTRFVATASHDLRQPLHAISMFVGVLRRRTSDPAILSVVENVATAVASMQRMFAALLDVARLDAGAIKIERRGVALQKLFDTLEVEFAPSITAKGLSLQIAPTPFSVSTDPALLETILRNLLSNAIKFTDHGLVGITTRRHADTVDIVVFDTGIGIAAEDQHTIFGQFERLSHPGGPREGLGLGLSIVQRTAELLGVTIGLQSTQGSGSQFTVSLPFAHTERAGILDEVGLMDADLRGHRILVLDDNTGARKAISLAIETLGGIPLEAASPEEAFTLLAAMAPETPCAAVVDHDLGHGQTGPEFLDAYAARNGQTLPAVVITGSTEAATLAALVAAGRSWLIKPIDLDVLRMILSTQLG